MSASLRLDQTTGSRKPGTLRTTPRPPDTRAEKIPTFLQSATTSASFPGYWSVSRARYSGELTLQVNVKRGVTFATGLRALLRQDPDVMLVGEIRDAETADLAVQATPPVGIPRPGRPQKLQRDRYAELEVLGAVHLSHAAATEQRDDAVALAQHRAG